MAKNNKTNRIKELVEEYTKRQDERAAEVKKLTEQKTKAEKEVDAAEGAFNNAAKNLTTDEIVEAGYRKAAAEQALTVISSALDAAQTRNAFTYDEINEIYRDFVNANNDVVDDANTEICKLLKQCEDIIDKADKASADLNGIFDMINQNKINAQPFDSGIVVRNVKGTIERIKQYNGKYWTK